jgi:hypothetical protein
MAKLYTLLGTALLAGAMSLFSPALKAEEPLYGQDEATKYQIEYGDREKQTKTKEGQLSLGQDLQKASAGQPDGPYQEYLEDKALEFLVKSNSDKAYESIVAIHKDDINDFPAQKLDYQKKVVDSYEDWVKKLSKNPDELSSRQGELCSEYFSLGKMYETVNDFTDAVDVLKKAQSIAKALKLADETQKAIQQRYDINNEAKNAFNSIASLKKKADSDATDKDSNFKVGEYYFNTGQFDVAQKYISNAGDRASKYSALLSQIDALKNDGMQESEHGLVKQDVERFSAAVKSKKTESIVELLNRIEVEDSLWSDIQKATVLLKQGKPEAYTVLSSLEQKASTLVQSGKQTILPGEDYAKLGDAFLTQSQNQTRKIEQIAMMQNALMYFNAATQKLGEGEQAAKIKSLSESLDKKLTELGAGKKSMDVAFSSGKMWNFDTDANCADFTKNWYTPENKDKPGFGWEKVGPSNYKCEGWEIKDGKLKGNGKNLFFKILKNEFMLKLELQYLTKRCMGIGIVDSAENNLDLNLYEDLDDKENLYAYSFNRNKAPEAVFKKNVGNIEIGTDYEILLTFKNKVMTYKVNATEVEIPSKEIMPCVLKIMCQDGTTCTLDNLSIK